MDNLTASKSNFTYYKQPHLTQKQQIGAFFCFYFIGFLFILCT